MQTIVWDIDDVLNDLMHAWFTETWKPAHPESGLSYKDLRDNPPYLSLCVKPSEYLASLDVFRTSPQAVRMAPNPVVIDWFRTHGHRFRHVALTARPLDSAPMAAEWLFRHLGDYFRCFGVVPSRPAPGTPQYDTDKAEFLRWLGGADYFIDDSEQNVAAVERLGVHAVLFPQPWNRATLTPQEALATLLDQLVAH
jgi:hypothetical protein